MRCLDRRLVEMTALVGALVQADSGAIRRAGEAVARLHSVADCADPRERVPLPADPTARAQIAAAEDDVARGHALHALARFDRALALAARAAEVGERTGWAPLLARALVLRGECENRQSQFQAAVATLERAATVAARAGDDALVAEALADRFYVLGERLGRPAEALKERTFIELALERAGQPPRQRAIWLHVLAVILLNQGKLDDALAAQAEGTAIWRKIVPPGHRNLLDSVETQANIQTTRGDFAASGALLDEVMAATVAASGPDHPKVAAVLTNTGFLELRRGNTLTALEHWRRAIRIFREAGDGDWIAPYNLGLLESGIGRWRDARATLSAALAAAEVDAPGDTLPVAACATALGAALTQLGEHDRAAETLERAVRAGRPAGDTWLVEALAAVARLALARGDLPTARAHLDQASRLVEPDHVSIALLAAEVERAEKGCRTARPALERVLAIAQADSVHEITAATGALAECSLELGDAAGAVARLEPRVRWQEEMGADAAAAAPLRFGLARALVASGGDRARARELAGSARAGFAELGAPGERRAAEVAQWLKRH
jgi:tetratricopeptide (TPR) repeat protein